MRGTTSSFSGISFWRPRSNVGIQSDPCREQMSLFGDAYSKFHFRVEASSCGRRRVKRRVPGWSQRFPSYVGPEFTLRDLLEVLLESSWALVPRQLPGGSGRVLGGPGRVFRAMLVLSSLLETSRSPSWSLPAPRGPSPASLRPFRIHREAILACLEAISGRFGRKLCHVQIFGALCRRIL